MIFFHCDADPFCKACAVFVDVTPGAAVDAAELDAEGGADVVLDAVCSAVAVGVALDQKLLTYDQNVCLFCEACIACVRAVEVVTDPVEDADEPDASGVPAIAVDAAPLVGADVLRLVGMPDLPDEA